MNVEDLKYTLKFMTREIFKTIRLVAYETEQLRKRVEELENKVSFLEKGE